MEPSKSDLGIFCVVQASCRMMWSFLTAFLQPYPLFEEVWFKTSQKIVYLEFRQIQNQSMHTRIFEVTYQSCSDRLA